MVRGFVGIFFKIKKYLIPELSITEFNNRINTKIFMYSIKKKTVFKIKFVKLEIRLILLYAFSCSNQ